MRSMRSWFDEALDQPAAQRQGWIEAHCPDPAIRERLRELLAVHEQTAPLLLDMPVAALVDSVSAGETPAPEIAIGTRIGAFRLVAPLGRGGMAAVYLGEREDVDFHQRVAVKLLRRGLRSDLQQALFRRERQTLAALSHPNIARLIDGGVTGDGIPYLVLDYVDGPTLTAYAAEHRLGVPARLRLFCEVCDAVESAHRQLIVHRDIKPSNILVDAGGTPKLLDFGIATLLQDAGSDEEMLPGALTPGYAAPEQYSARPVSTATDVYALGVLLYELLLGERPAASPACPASIHALRAEPVRWSVPASRRDMHAALRGDLDCILGKALSPQPEERYASAGALAAEVRRHLRRFPIEARPQTAAYRASKFVSRHRGGVTVAIGLTLGLFASLALALWQAGVANREAAHAREQATVARQEMQRANAVRDLLVGLFENEWPDSTRDSLPDTATLLQRGAVRARTELSSTPALQVEMLTVIGRIYNELSRFDDARPLLQEAVDIARKLPASDRRTLAWALSQRGKLAFYEDKYDETLPHIDEALRILRELDPAGLDTAQTYYYRAMILSALGRHAEAIADHKAAIMIQQAQLPEDDQRLLSSYGALGSAYAGARRYDEAFAWQQRALALVRKRYGDTHIETARRLGSYGSALMGAGRALEAEAPIAEAAAIMRRIHPAPHADVAWMAQAHGSVLIALGRIDEAEPLLKEAQGINRAIGLGRTLTTGFTLARLSHVRQLQGDLTGALQLADEGFGMIAESLPPGVEARLAVELRHMRLRLLLGQARDLTADAAELQKRADAVGSSRLSAVALYVRGLAHAAHGEDARALPMLEQAVRMADQPQSYPHDVLEWFATLGATRRRMGDAKGADDARRDGLAFADKWKIPAAHPARIALQPAQASQDQVNRH